MRETHMTERIAIPAREVKPGDVFADSSQRVVLAQSNERTTHIRLTQGFGFDNLFLMPHQMVSVYRQGAEVLV